MFFYGISRRFYLCDISGHLLRNIRLADNYEKTLNNFYSLSSLDISASVAENIDIFKNNNNISYLNDIKLGEMNIWKAIADAELNGNLDCTGMIDYYNIGSGEEPGNFRESDDDCLRYLCYDTTMQTYSHNTQTSFWFRSFENYHKNGEFVAVISANSYDSLKEKLPKIKIQHPSLRLAGFITDSDASYINDCNLNQTKSIYDDDINFMSLNKTTTDFLSTHEFYRPYHNILIPVFYVPGTIVVNMCNNNSYKSICESKANEISTAIDNLKRFSSQSIINNFEYEVSGQCDLCAINTGDI